MRALAVRLKTLFESAEAYGDLLLAYLNERGIEAKTRHPKMSLGSSEYKDGTMRCMTIVVDMPQRPTSELPPIIRIRTFEDGHTLAWWIGGPPRPKNLGLKTNMHDPDSYQKIEAFIREHLDEA